MDLELFYENQEILISNIDQVSTGIIRNLDKNQIIVPS